IFNTIFQKVSIAITSTVIAITGLFVPAPQLPATPPQASAPSEIPTSASSKVQTALPVKAPAHKAKSPTSPTETKTTVPTHLTNAEIIQKVRPAVVFIQAGTQAGSGFVLESSGIILTNAHVVRGVNSTVVKFSDGDSRIGTVLGRNEIVDLALIKIDASNL